jgi:hypothetical protein
MRMGRKLLAGVIVNTWLGHDHYNRYKTPREVVGYVFLGDGVQVCSQ